MSGGVNLGSKIEKEKTTIEPKKKPTLIESYDSDENSDENSDDEIEVIGKKRKKRGDSSEDDDDDDNNNIEEEQDETNRPIGSVSRKFYLKKCRQFKSFRVTMKLKYQLFNVNHQTFNIHEHVPKIQHQSETSIRSFIYLLIFVTPFVFIL